MINTLNCSRETHKWDCSNSQATVKSRDCFSPHVNLNEYWKLLKKWFLKKKIREIQLFILMKPKRNNEWPLDCLWTTFQYRLLKPTKVEISIMFKLYTALESQTNKKKVWTSQTRFSWISGNKWGRRTDLFSCNLFWNKKERILRC